MRPAVHVDFVPSVPDPVFGLHCLPGPWEGTARKSCEDKLGALKQRHQGRHTEGSELLWLQQFRYNPSKLQRGQGRLVYP